MIHRNKAISRFIWIFLLLINSIAVPNQKRKCSAFTTSLLNNKPLRSITHPQKVVQHSKTYYYPFILPTHPIQSSSLLQLKQRQRNEDKEEKEVETVELQRYNDDAFGLVFLIGGFAYQDVDFAVTFLLLSALTAVGTSKGKINVDARIPGVVAILSLLVAPIVCSLRVGSGLGLGIGGDGLLDGSRIGIPSSVEIVVCFISLITGFYKWNKEQKK